MGWCNLKICQIIKEAIKRANLTLVSSFFKSLMSSLQSKYLWVTLYLYRLWKWTKGNKKLCFTKPTVWKIHRFLYLKGLYVKLSVHSFNKGAWSIHSSTPLNLTPRNNLKRIEFWQLIWISYSPIRFNGHHFDSVLSLIIWRVTWIYDYCLFYL